MNKPIPAPTSTAISQDCTADMISQEFMASLAALPEMQGLFGEINFNSINKFATRHQELMRGALSRALDKSNQILAPKTKE